MADTRAVRVDVPDAPTVLAELVRTLRAHPGLRGKAAIGLVSEVLGPADWICGPGDDGAVVNTLGGQVVACGEALWPPFVAADPYGAGFAAVLTNVNDLAAMGALPLGIVDTIVGSEAVARSALLGMRRAGEFYDVPILGGHLTLHDGEPAVSAFGVGTTSGQALSVTRVRAGQSLLVAAALDGRLRPDFPFFRAFEERGSRCAGDVRLFAGLAESGACVAAKDISMAGLVGSLAMLLEWGRHGVVLDLEAVPVPSGLGLPAWLTCFPSFGFLLCAPAGRETDCAQPFLDRGLHAAVVGRINDSGQLALRLGSASATVLDLAIDDVTRLGRP
ncbi:MAG: AIR synthase related protein [Pseudonocardiaceae bacterium]